MDADFDPSLPLPDERQEKFCLAVANSMSYSKAYAEAGYKPDGKNASALASRPYIKARIAYLRTQVGVKTTALVVRKAAARVERAERAVETAIVTREWIMAALLENAEICLGRRPIKVMKAIKGKRHDGVETVEVLEITVTERDAAGANRALELLGKESAMPFDGEVRAREGLTATIKTIDDAGGVVMIDRFRARKTA